MGLLSLVFKNTQRTKIEGVALDGDPITLEIDATTTMSHERSATPTKNPIETGSNVTDHIILDNNKLSIEGVITNNPITLIQSEQTILSQKVVDQAVDRFGVNRGLSSGLFGSVGRLLVNDDNRVENSFRYLEEIHKSRAKFKIFSGLKDYDNMVLSKLSVPQTAADGDSIRFSATFEQINIVKSQLVTVPLGSLVDNVKHTAQKTINAGKQETKEVSEKVNQKASIAYTVFKKFL